MIDGLIAGAMIGLLVLGPLVWRARQDRRRARALVLQADLDAALRGALGGESFVTVHVEPSTAWRRGQVVLSAPVGWRCLIERAWERVAARMPAGYDLVIRGTTSAATTAAPPFELAA